MSELDSLLDTTLDDLADLPSFQPFVAGTHRVLASFDTKEINGKAAVELSFKMIETIECADSNDQAALENGQAPNKEGDTSNTMFMLANEFGQGNLKKCAVPFVEAFNYSTIREVVEGVKEVECVVITSLRADKNDPDKKYLQVKEIAVV